MIFHSLLSSFLPFLTKLDRLTSSLLQWLIIQIRPMLGPMDVCPFALGCTNFALETLKNHITPVATAKIIKRLLRCNPVWFWYQRLTLHSK